MAFKLPKTLITEQGEFPFAALTLIVSPSFQEDRVEAQIVLKCSPYNLIDGKVIRPTEIVQSELEDGSFVEIEVPTNKYDLDVLFGTGYADAQKNPALAEALLGISKYLQKFILLGMPDKEIGE